MKGATRPNQCYGEGEAKYTYGGKELDDATNLYYFNARYYDATIGRFINVDPIQDGTNWYVYCNNNPLSFVDPTGLEDDDVVNVSVLFTGDKSDVMKSKPLGQHNQTDITYTTANNNKYCDFTSIFNIIEKKFGKELDTDFFNKAAGELIDKNILHADGRYKGDYKNVDDNGILKGRTEVANYIWNSMLKQEGSWSFTHIEKSQVNERTIMQNKTIGNGADHFFNFLGTMDNGNFVIRDTFNGKIKTVDKNDSGFVTDKKEWNYSFTDMILNK